MNADITDLVIHAASSPEPISIHCYLPLKHSFKWIKIVKEIPSKELLSFVHNDEDPEQNNELQTVIGTDKMETKGGSSGSSSFNSSIFNVLTIFLLTAMSASLHS